MSLNQDKSPFPWLPFGIMVAAMAMLVWLVWTV